MTSETGRLFYGDPLAAAWMAREHDCRMLYNPCGEFEISLNALLQDVYSGSKLPSYVHPNSLALFAPRVGDVVHCGNLFWIVEDESDVSKIMAQEYRIILRDGRSFIMPEAKHVEQ